MCSFAWLSQLKHPNILLNLFPWILVQRRSWTGGADTVTLRNISKQFCQHTYKTGLCRTNTDTDGQTPRRHPTHTDRRSLARHRFTLTIQKVVDICMFRWSVVAAVQKTLFGSNASTTSHTQSIPGDPRWTGGIYFVVELVEGAN